MAGEPLVEGDYFGEIKEPKKDPSPEPREVNLFHKRSDVNSGPNAQHHTIGVDRNKASPGDHVHDGKSSRKLGHAQGLTISGSKGGNAALASLITMLGNFIDFTDNTT